MMVKYTNVILNAVMNFVDTRSFALLWMTVLLLFSLSTNSNAELTLDVSEPTLEITTGFTGDTLTIFGTVEPKGDIVIVVKGPQKETTIRRKIDVLGLWINAESVTFKSVPEYYNVASSRPMVDIASPEIRQQYRLGINSLTFNSVKEHNINKKDRFQEALIQNKQLTNLYSLTPDAIDFLNESLFKTRIYMPSSVPIGTYEIDAYLFKDGQLIDQASHPFFIKQVGLAAEVHNFAYGAPFWYGVSVILFALFSSFLAIALLRRE